MSGCWVKMGAMSEETIVYMRHGELRRPVFRVVEASSGDVQVYVRAGRDEHVSIHRNDEPEFPLVITHHAPELASSTWDPVRVEAARSAQIEDAERHGNYTFNLKLSKSQLESPVLGMDGIHIVGRRIVIGDATDKPKYEKGSKVELNAPGAECMVDIVLSTQSRPCQDRDAARVATGFGDVCFLLGK